MRQDDYDYLEIPASATKREGRCGIGEVFDAQRACDRWQAWMALSSGALAVLSVPMAALLLRSSGPSAGSAGSLVPLVLLGWAVMAASYVAARFGRQGARRTLARTLEDAGGRAIRARDP